MRFRYFIIVLLVLAGSFFFLPSHSARAAFGISPPFLNADHLVAGAKYTQVVYLVQDQPDEDLNIQANLQMDDPARSWISIDRGFNFVIPKGTRQYPVTITVNIPQGTGLGAYHGNLTFTTAPAAAGQVTIALGAQVAINLTVGTGIYEKYSVPLVGFPDIYEGGDPEVNVKFENDGNIPESFDSATYELYDQYDAVRLAYVQKNDGFPATPPFTVKDYTITFPIDFYLGIGQYWGVVTFYKNGQAVASQKTVFNVLKAGPLAMLMRFLRDDWAYILFATIILAILIWYFARKRRRGARSK